MFYNVGDVYNDLFPYKPTEAPNGDWKVIETQVKGFYRFQCSICVASRQENSLIGADQL
jgi:hypothetical protein